MRLLQATAAVAAVVICAGCIQAPPAEVIDVDKITLEAWSQGYAQGKADEHNQAAAILQEYDLLLKKATYDEVKAFIQEDGTDQMMVANCLTRAERLNNEAISRGMWSYIVLFNFYTGTSYGFHAIAAFDTKDKGLIFIEPQSDDEVKCDLGINYAEEMSRSGKVCRQTPMIIRQIGIIR